jgi:hypothetical protein
MGGSSFEQLIGEVFNQKQRMDELLAENYELRRQLADLRDGRGILLEIQGQLFSLDGEIVAQAPPVEPVSQEALVAEQATTIMHVSEAAIGAGIFPETPVPGSDQFEQIPYSIDKEEEKVPSSSSSFLEEMLVDEFAAAATSPMAVWQGSKTRKLVAIDEEEKAALRKQLIGSYILE